VITGPANGLDKPGTPHALRIPVAAAAADELALTTLEAGTPGDGAPEGTRIGPNKSVAVLPLLADVVVVAVAGAKPTAPTTATSPLPADIGDARDRSSQSLNGFPLCAVAFEDGDFDSPGGVVANGIMCIRLAPAARPCGKL